MRNPKLSSRSFAAATITAMTFAALLGITQASAQVLLQTVSDCKGELATVEPMVVSMKDGQDKDAAMKELGAAKAMMAKNDEKACLERLRNARRMTRADNRD